MCPEYDGMPYSRHSTAFSISPFCIPTPTVAFFLFIGMLLCATCCAVLCYMFHTQLFLPPILLLHIAICLSLIVCINIVGRIAGT